MKSNPTVSVVMPVRNEAGFIAQSLKAVLNQDYPASCIEIIIADGMSTDGTRAIIQSLQAGNPRLQLIDNPGRIVPTGLNAAIARASGDIIIRVDGHCRIAPDYVSRCVEHLQHDDVDGVGGPVRTMGETLVARAIAAAMSSPFGVGGSSFRTVQERNVVADTIPFPAYTRAIIERVGTYDEEQVRNQDDEYNYRLRKMGGKLLLARDVRSEYYSRSTILSLFRQYFQYGYWKVRVLQKHPRQMCVEQFVPLFLVLGLLIALGLSMVSDVGLGLLLFGSAMYFTAALVATVVRIRREKKAMACIIPFAFVALHGGYGAGFLVGLIRFWDRWGDSGIFARRLPAKLSHTQLSARSAPEGL